MIRRSPIAAAVFCLMLEMTAALAQDEKAVNRSIDTVLGDHARYQAAIGKLQTAVAAKDAAAVAALVSYPINVAVAGKKTVIKNADAFVQNYEKIVTPTIASAVTTQKYGELMVNAQGVMFGNGEVWLNGICLDKACKQSEPKVVTIQEAPKK
jgi:ketosteroid isomerase-like protein